MQRLASIWKGPPPVLMAAICQGLAFVLLGCAMGIGGLATVLPGAAWLALQGCLSFGFHKTLQAWLFKAQIPVGKLWFVTHLAMPFLIYIQLFKSLPAWFYPLGLMILLLFFGGGLFTRVPLYNSNRRAWKLVLEQLPDRPIHFVDLGSGLGGLLVYLAKNRPESRFVGVESSPLVWLLSWIRALRHPNIHLRWGSLWREDLSTFDIAHAFLSPAPMAALWEKVAKEMRENSLLLSHSFEVPAVEPAKAIPLPDHEDRYLYVYKPLASKIHHR